MKLPSLRRASVYVVLISAAVVGCSPSVLDFRNAEIVNGKVYKQGADSGFSGRVTNVPDARLLLSQKGFTALSKTIQAAIGLNHTLDRLLLSSSLCDAITDAGVLDGEVTCTIPQTKTLRYRMKFEAGALDGPITLYDLTEQNNILTTASFHKGVLDGKQEIFGLKTQKIISRISWKNGIVQGVEESFDETTGEKIGHYNYVDGKLDGDIVRYAPDGKRVIYRAKFSSGLLNGLEERFDPETGKPLRYADWSLGKRNGTFKEWDAEGNLRSDAVYAFDSQVSANQISVAPTATSGGDVTACVDRWSAAFHNERGQDTIVTVDQLDEWQGWCKQGKLPA